MCYYTCNYHVIMMNTIKHRKVIMVCIDYIKSKAIRFYHLKPTFFFTLKIDSMKKKYIYSHIYF